MNNLYACISQALARF